MEVFGKIFLLATVITLLMWDVSANQTQTPDSSALGPATPSFELPKNLTLRRCRCPELQDSECIDQETRVSVLNYSLALQEVFHSAEFSEVTVRDINCPPGLMKGKLSSFADNVFILTTGELFWIDMDMFFKDYCIEPVTGGAWGAHICLEPPHMPRCCPQGQVLGPEGGSCIESSSSLSFAPPLMFNNEVLKNVEYGYDGPLEVTCSGIEVERILSLNGENGVLRYIQGEALLTYIPPPYYKYVEPEQQYCVGINGSASADSQYVAKFCYTDPREEHFHTCRNFTCVKKCCPYNQFFMNGACAQLKEGEVGWAPIFHEIETLKPGAAAPENLLMDFGLPYCEKFFRLDPETIDSDKSYLLRDGSLYFSNQENLSPDRYCLDSYMDANGAFKEIAFVCHPEESCLWKPVLDVVLLSLSCVFLIATLAVYLGVADLRDRTNGRCLVSMVAAMLAAYVSLIVNNQAMNPTELKCLLTAFSGHVFGLAMFFWLNVMCYDMWATLRSSHQQHQSKKTFIKYSIYAWGTPLLIGIITMILDRVQPQGIILPNYLENKSCWFKGDAEYWLYLSGIIVILVLVNLFFFIHVAITLARKLRKRQSVFDNSNSRTSRNSGRAKQQAWLYVKLFIVMGVVWIADVTSSIRHRNTCTFWVVTDILNGLQGVFIFLVAVCNRDNLKKFHTAWEPRVSTVRTKISTMRGRPTISGNNRRKTADSLATSETSRKTSVTSLPRKISTVSVPPQYLANARKDSIKLNEQHALFTEDSRNHGSTLPSRKISLASNLETIPMDPSE